MSDNDDKREPEEPQDPSVDPKDEDTGREDPNDAGTGGDTDDADEDDDEDDEPKKVYTKADIEKAAKRRQAALDRARKAEKELSELRKATATKEQRLQIEAEEKAAEQAAKFKPALVKQHVAYEMSFLGLNKGQIGELVQFVDMENIDVDLEDNSVSGVEEEVLRIQQKFPSLFPKQGEEDEDGEKKTPRRKRTPKGDGSPKPPPQKPLTTKEKIAARLRGENV